MKAKPSHNPSASNDQRGFALSVMTSPLGRICIETANYHLIALTYVANDTPLQLAEDVTNRKIVSELEQYFKNAKATFTPSLLFTGTDFQQSVWKALLSIPVGQTLTYGTLANHLKTSPRAIGQACRTNPIPIIVPCHRVVGKADIGGYSGMTQGAKLDIKKWLLLHELKIPSQTI